MDIRNFGIAVFSVILSSWVFAENNNSLLPELRCKQIDEETERSIVEPFCVADSIQMALAINARENIELPPDRRPFQIHQGSRPVIITAPHATRPMREEKRRFSDGGGTAALALAISKLTNASSIYMVFEGPSDPNYYDENEFKAQLKELVETTSPVLILDIHGSHPHRSYDVDIGTMSGQSLLTKTEFQTKLIERLDDEGLDSVSINRFGASKNETVTKFASGLGVPAMQLEINATWVSPEKGDIYAQRYAKLLQAISKFILEVSSSN